MPLEIFTYIGRYAIATTHFSSIRKKEEKDTLNILCNMDINIILDMVNCKTSFQLLKTM